MRDFVRLSMEVVLVLYWLLTTLNLLNRFRKSVKPSTAVIDAFAFITQPHHIFTVRPSARRARRARVVPGPAGRV